MEVCALGPSAHDKTQVKKETSYEPIPDKIAQLGVAVPNGYGAPSAIEAAGVWRDFYHFSWFVSFGVAFVVYLVLMAGQPTEQSNADRL